jgi:hypothetical protein
VRQAQAVSSTQARHRGSQASVPYSTSLPPSHLAARLGRRRRNVVGRQHCVLGQREGCVHRHERGVKQAQG